MDDLAGKLRAIAETTPNQANGFNVLNASAREAISAAAEALERPTVGANVGAENRLNAWKLVPVEPTELMLQGGSFHHMASRAMVRKVWDWMLSRAPEPPLNVGAEVGAGGTSPEKSADTSVV